MSTRVVTGKVRLSYAHLFEPWTNDPTKEARCGTVILVPKTDKKTIKAIQDAQQEALQNGIGKFGGKVPKVWKNSFRDGDEEADLDRNPEYAGHMYMSVSTFGGRKPSVVDHNVQDIFDATQVYSGGFAKVAMTAFAYNREGSKGISFGLENVQWLGGGEPLDGRVGADSDFEATEAEESEEDDVI